MCIKYISQALIDPALTPELFMKDYCGRFGISDESTFVKMIKRVELAENFVNYKMFNIAFCMPNLLFGTVGTGSLPRYSKEDFDHIIGEYDAITIRCEKILAKTKDRTAIAYLRLFRSRCRASYWHLRGAFTIGALAPICDGKTHMDLTTDEKTKIAMICDEALAFSSNYLETVAECMPDRGSQGLLLSYYLNFPAYYHYLKKYYTVGADIADYRTGPYDRVDTDLVCPMPYL
jgi:hypothetical protein